MRRVLIAVLTALSLMLLAVTTASADKGLWPDHGWGALAKRPSLTLAAASTITYVGKTSGTNAATSLSVADPGAGREIALVSVGSDSSTVNTPSGWTKIAGPLADIDTPDGDSFQAVIFTASNPSGSVSFTKSNTKSWQIVRMAYSNVASVTAALQKTPNGTTHNLPALTVPAGGLQLGVGFNDEGSTNVTYTPPTGWTERHDSVGNGGATLAVMQNDPDGGAVTQQYNTNVSDWVITGKVALAPAAPANTAPVVSAGPDLTGVVNEDVILPGSASDDGLPNGTLSSLWSRVTTPGTVFFYDANIPASKARFSAAGVYVLRLTSSDGSLSSSDDVTITITEATPPPPTNAAPTVSAGADQSVTMPNSANLDGTVSDDGLPSGSTVTQAWSQVSGTGTTTFGDATAVDTTASFSAAGTYVLRLTASDGALSSSDDVTVTVADVTPPPSGIPAPQSGFSRIMTDEFSGTALDTTKWTAYSSPLSSSSGCPRPENNIVGGGVLTMLFAYDTSGYCGAQWYHGSMMVKAAYGENNQSVTLRYRIVANDPANTRSHHILPMRWPNQDPWYVGESDYCETSSYTDCTTFLHHSSSTQQVASPDHVFDMTQWHTFRATQRPGNDVDIFIDNMTTPVWSYNGTTTTVPDVIKRTVLQQECRSSCPTNTAGWEKIEVDWLTIDNGA